jgi:hypothetical protein
MPPGHLTDGISPDHLTSSRKEDTYECADEGADVLLLQLRRLMTYDKCREEGHWARDFRILFSKIEIFSFLKMLPVRRTSPRNAERMMYTRPKPAIVYGYDEARKNDVSRYSNVEGLLSGLKCRRPNGEVWIEVYTGKCMYCLRKTVIPFDVCNRCLRTVFKLERGWQKGLCFIEGCVQRLIGRATCLLRAGSRKEG